MLRECPVRERRWGGRCCGWTDKSGGLTRWAFGSSIYWASGVIVCGFFRTCVSCNSSVVFVQLWVGALFFIQGLLGVWDVQSWTVWSREFSFMHWLLPLQFWIHIWISTLLASSLIRWFHSILLPSLWLQSLFSHTMSTPTPTLTTNYLHIPPPNSHIHSPSSCHAKLLQFRWDSVEIKVGTSKVTSDLNSWVWILEKALRGTRNRQWWHFAGECGEWTRQEGCLLLPSFSSCMLHNR